MQTKTVESGKKRAKHGGRQKGSVNKATANAREAIARFVDGNAERMQGWLDDIAADEKQGPREAFRCMMEVMEYHVPKLARTVVVGDTDHPQVFEFRWQK